MADNPLFLTSKDNPKIKELIALFEKRERDATGLFVIEGFREISRALHGHVKIVQFFICPELFLGENENELIEKAKKAGAQIITCSDRLFEKISYRDRPDGLIAIAKQMQHTLHDLEKAIKKQKTAPCFVIAQAIEKPGNLGTILRSADSSGATGVIVVDRCTDIYNPNVVRASVGTLFTLPVIEATSTEALQWLTEHNVEIVAATPSATKLYTDIDCTRPVAIAVGAEQIGLSDFWLQAAKLRVKIPMHGVADSLNVAMATTILLYEIVRQRNA